MNEALAEFRENLTDEREEAFAAFCNNQHTDPKSDAAAELIEEFEESYQGAFESENAFAEDLMTSTMAIPDELLGFIDFGRFWDELQKSGDYWSQMDSDGWWHIFRG